MGLWCYCDVDGWVYSKQFRRCTLRSPFKKEFIIQLYNLTENHQLAESLGSASVFKLKALKNDNDRPEEWVPVPRHLCPVWSPLGSSLLWNLL